MSDPNPGSPEARKQGCKCPRYDNHHGDGYHIDPATGEPMFVIREDCPLHGPVTTEVHDDAEPIPPAYRDHDRIVGEDDEGDWFWSICATTEPDDDAGPHRPR